MFTCNWRSTAAAIGVTLAVLLTKWEPAEAQERNGASSHGYTRAPNISWIFDGTPPGEEINHACDKYEENRNSDLCAQWKAADAAHESAVWSAKTYAVEIVGAVSSIFTLLAAVAAAFFAKDAAKWTKAAAKAASRATVIARNSLKSSDEHLRMQNKCYVNPVRSEVDVEISEDRLSIFIRIRFEVKNYGVTPAYRVSTSIEKDGSFVRVQSVGAKTYVKYFLSGPSKTAVFENISRDQPKEIKSEFTFEPKTKGLKDVEKLSDDLRFVVFAAFKISSKDIYGAIDSVVYQIDGRFGPIHRGSPILNGICAIEPKMPTSIAVPEAKQHLQPGDGKASA